MTFLGATHGLRQTPTSFQLQKDGIDHINISVFGETELGRYLSPDWRQRFHIPFIGDFGTVKFFAHWMASGGGQRLNVPLHDFRTLVLFAKVYQFQALRLELPPLSSPHYCMPWVMYREHLSGVKETDRWSTYPVEIRRYMAMFQEQSNNDSFVWGEPFKDTLSVVNHYLQKITGENFVPFEKLDDFYKEAIHKRDKEHEDPPSDPLPTIFPFCTPNLSLGNLP